MTFLKDKKYEPWLAAGLIALASALTYGILVPQLGFYRDDWYMLWAGQSPDGVSAIIRLFQTDRPFTGLIYALLYSILGANVLLWQVFGLILKIFTGLAALWLLRMIWPEKRLETTITALLFVVYPGFYQQPVPGTFCTDLICLICILVSMGLTVFSIRTSNGLLKILATLASVILGLVNLGLYESLVGMEVMRWVLIGVIIHQNSDQPMGKSLREKIRWVVSRKMLAYIAPYLVMLAIFLVWRLFFFTSTRRATNISVLLSAYAGNPLYSIAQILIEYIKDLFEGLALAWFVPFYQFTAEGRFNVFLPALVLALVVLVLAGMYLFWLRQNFQDAGAESMPGSFLLVGLTGFLVPAAVIVLLGRNVLFAIQWDRYTTPSMFGISLVVYALALKVFRGNARRIFLGTLVVLAVMTQYHSAAFYRDFWSYQQQSWQQLTWRAPGLAKNANVVMVLPQGFRLAEEYEVWGPVNMIYNPGQLLQTSGQVLDDSLYYNLLRGTDEERLMRNVDISRDYKNSLIMSIPGPGACLHVYDGANPELSPFDDAQVKLIAPFSKISMILPEGNPHSLPWISIQPQETWCYYYQKMSLARQLGDWQTASQLADEAAQKGLKPVELVEWMPALDAYASTGQEKKANDIAKRVKSDTDLRTSLCVMLDKRDSSPQGYNALLVMSLLCSKN